MNLDKLIKSLLIIRVSSGGRVSDCHLDIFHRLPSAVTSTRDGNGNACMDWCVAPISRFQTGRLSRMVCRLRRLSSCFRKMLRRTSSQLFRDSRLITCFEEVVSFRASPGWSEVWDLQGSFALQLAVADELAQMAIVHFGLELSAYPLAILSLHAPLDCFNGFWSERFLEGISYYLNQARLLVLHCDVWIGE